MRIHASTVRCTPAFRRMRFRWVCTVCSEMCSCRAITLGSGHSDHARITSNCFLENRQGLEDAVLCFIRKELTRWACT